MEEEVVLLEEQLAAAQGDVERLQVRLTEAESREQQRITELTELRGVLTSREEALSARAAELEAARAQLDESQGRMRDAAQRYRQVVLEREPDLPSDLIDGASVTEIDEAVAQARQTVLQVRQHLEQQAQAVRVPAGAPVRGAPDTSQLTAAEKIRQGLRESR